MAENLLGSIEKFKEIHIRLAGFGGQGIILAGLILGRAVSLYDHRNAEMTQSYGAETRGGSSTVTLVISEGEIVCPIVEKADILVALNQKGFDEYISDVKKNGLIIIDPGLVKIVPNHLENSVIRVPFTQIAQEHFENRIYANMVMLGTLVRTTKVVTKEALLMAVRDSVPKVTEELNLRAVDKGYQAETTKVEDKAD